MHFLKSYLKKKYKLLIQGLFKLFYPKIKIASPNEIKNFLTNKQIVIEDITYNIFKTNKARLYTTSVHDQSVIIENKLIPGPSFQLRIKENDKFFARNNGK